MYKICRFIGTNLFFRRTGITSLSDLFKGTVSVDHIKGAIFISIFSFKFSLSFTVRDRINRIDGWCLGWVKFIGLGSEIYLVCLRLTR